MQQKESPNETKDIKYATNLFSSGSEEIDDCNSKGVEIKESKIILEEIRK